MKVTGDVNRFRRGEHLSTTDKIELSHIGEDYIGVTVNGEYAEITGYAQEIVYALLKRLNLRGCK